MKKFYLTVSLVALMIFATPGTSSAIKIGETNPLANITVQDSRLAWSLSNEYHLAVDSKQISFLRNQDLSYAEIVALYGLADASNKPFAVILDMRQDDHLKWSEILVRLNLESSDITEKAILILKANKLDAETPVLTSLFVNDPISQTTEEKVVKSKKATQPQSSKSTYNSSGKSRF